MRNDLESMKAGKGMAQASHAAITFVHDIPDDHKELYEQWKNETTQGFGTTIVLGANIEELELIVSMAAQLDILSGIVVDPTYPILDGKIVTHLLELETCGYVFGNNNEELTTLLQNLKFYP